MERCSRFKLSLLKVLLLEILEDLGSIVKEG